MPQAAEQEQHPVFSVLGQLHGPPIAGRLITAKVPITLPSEQPRVAWSGEVAQVAQIFGGVNTLSGYVGTESVSAEFSTVASEL